MLFCLRMRSTFACVFDWECKLFFYIRMCGGVLSLNALKSCCLNIRSPNVAKEVLHCKNYTSIIKLTNLSVFFPSLKSSISPLLPLFQLWSVSSRLVFDELYKYNPNGKCASWYRHGTGSCVWRSVCVHMHTNTHTHALRHTAKTNTITVYELR